MSAYTPLPAIVREIDRVDAAPAEQARQYAASIWADVAGRRGGLPGRTFPSLSFS